MSDIINTNIFNITANEALYKSTEFKSIALYDDAIYESEIMRIINPNPAIAEYAELSVENNGAQTIISCSTKDADGEATSAPEGYTENFAWTVKDNVGNTLSVPNNGYTVSGATLTINDRTVMTGDWSISCRVYYTKSGAQDIYGADSQTIVVSKLIPQYGSCQLIGGRTYLYNEGGNRLENSLNTPIEVIVYDEEGVVVDFNGGSGYTVQWTYPESETMVKRYSPESGVNSNFTYYSIAETYNINWTNNIIKATVTRTNAQGLECVCSAEVNIGFSFQGQPGTNGTRYSCRIVEADHTGKLLDSYAQWGALRSTSSKQYWKCFGVEITDIKNGTVVANSYNQSEYLSVTWSGLGETDPKKMLTPTGKVFQGAWFNQGNRQADGSYSSSNATEKSLSDNSTLYYYDGGASIDKANYIRILGKYANISSRSCNILQAKVSFKETQTAEPLEFYAYMPMSINTHHGIKIKANSGFSHILFGSDGKNPQYANVPFELQVYANNDNDYVYDVTNSATYQWKLLAPLSNPKVSYKNEKNSCKVNYNDNFVANQPWINLETTVSNILDKNGSSPLNEKKISIPIVMSLNRYQNPNINGWDGQKIIVDEDKNFIASMQAGFGQKNEDNTFSGLVLGTIQKKGKKNERVGLFGYNKGKETVSIDALSGDARFNGDVYARSFQPYVATTDADGNIKKDDNGNIIYENVIQPVATYIYYAEGDSASTSPESGWSETYPAYDANRTNYIWQKTVEYYTLADAQKLGYVDKAGKVDPIKVSYANLTGAKGQKGDDAISPFTLDLSNDVIVLPADEDGEITLTADDLKEFTTITAALYQGDSDRTADAVITWTPSSSDITVSPIGENDDTKRYISAMKVDGASITVNAKIIDTKTNKAIVSIDKVVTVSKNKQGVTGGEGPAAVGYRIIPQETPIKLNNNTSATLKFKIQKAEGSELSEVTSLTDNDRLTVMKVGTSGSLTATYSSGYWTVSLSNLTAATKINIKLEKKNTDNSYTLLDEETISCVTDGSDFEGVILSTSAQAIKYKDGGYHPDEVTISAALYGDTVEQNMLRWIGPDGKPMQYRGTSYTLTNLATIFETVDSVTYKVFIDKNKDNQQNASERYEDSITIYKLVDGENGASAISAFLSNQSINWSGDKDGVIKGVNSQKTEVNLYYGFEKLAFDASKKTSSCIYTIAVADKDYPRKNESDSYSLITKETNPNILTWNVKNYNLGNAGELNGSIPVQVSYQIDRVEQDPIILYWSWSKNNTGATGSPGLPGVPSGYHLSASSQIINVDQNGDITPNSTITVSLTKQGEANSTTEKWFYSINGGAFQENSSISGLIPSTGSINPGIAVANNISSIAVKVVEYKDNKEVKNGYTDILTIYVNRDGQDGDPATLYYLDNEYFEIIGNKEGSIINQQNIQCSVMKTVGLDTTTLELNDNDYTLVVTDTNNNIVQWEDVGKPCHFLVGIDNINKCIAIIIPATGGSSDLPQKGFVGIQNGSLKVTLNAKEGADSTELDGKTFTIGWSYVAEGSSIENLVYYKGTSDNNPPEWNSGEGWSLNPIEPSIDMKYVWTATVMRINGELSTEVRIAKYGTYVTQQVLYGFKTFQSTKTIDVLAKEECSVSYVNNADDYYALIKHPYGKFVESSFKTSMDTLANVQWEVTVLSLTNFALRLKIDNDYRTNWSIEKSALFTEAAFQLETYASKETPYWPVPNIPEYNDEKQAWISTLEINGHTYSWEWFSEIENQPFYYLFKIQRDVYDENAKTQYGPWSQPILEQVPENESALSVESMTLLINALPKNVEFIDDAQGSFAVVGEDGVKRTVINASAIRTGAFVVQKDATTIFSADAGNKQVQLADFKVATPTSVSSDDMETKPTTSNVPASFFYQGSFNNYYTTESTGTELVPHANLTSGAGSMATQSVPLYRRINKGVYIGPDGIGVGQSSKEDNGGWSGADQDRSRFWVNKDGQVNMSSGIVQGAFKVGGCIYTGDRSGYNSAGKGVYIAQGGIRIGPGSGVYDSKEPAQSDNNKNTPQIELRNDGTFIAKKGCIGGWTIDSTKIYGTSYTSKKVIKNGVEETEYTQVPEDTVGLSPVSTAGDNTMGRVRFWAGSANASTSAPFFVTSKGYVKATKGTIGGWNIGIDTLQDANTMVGLVSYNGNDVNSQYYNKSEESRIRFWAGNKQAKDSPFQICENGAMIASKGTIGTLMIDKNGLKSVNNSGIQTFSLTSNGFAIDTDGPQIALNKLKDGTYGTKWFVNSDDKKTYLQSANSSMILEGNAASTSSAIIELTGSEDSGDNRITANLYAWKESKTRIKVSIELNKPFKRIMETNIKVRLRRLSIYQGLSELDTEKEVKAALIKGTDSHIYTSTATATFCPGDTVKTLSFSASTFDEETYLTIEFDGAPNKLENLVYNFEKMKYTSRDEIPAWDKVTPSKSFNEKYVTSNMFIQGNISPRDSTQYSTLGTSTNPWYSLNVEEICMLNKGTYGRKYNCLRDELDALWGEVYSLM